MDFFLGKILDWIFPPKCGFCGDITMSEHFICEECRDLSTQRYINRCDFCGKISSVSKCFECSKKEIYYEKLVFCSEYTEDFKQKIHLYKFSDKKYFYHFFTELLYERVKNEKFDVIMPVPISHERYKERGYNQSGLIAKKLAGIMNKPYEGKALLKIKNSERQSIQSYKERQKSVKNVFKVDDILRVKDKSILLIDDIFTTGATANECSRVLKNAGAKSIKVGVICVSHTLKWIRYTAKYANVSKVEKYFENVLSFLTLCRYINHKGKKITWLKEVFIMRITGNVGSVTGVYTNDKRISRVDNTNKISPASDDVKISNVGKDFTIAMNALKNVPDVRMDRVNEISARIASGEYNVSGEDIASKMLGE